MATDEHDHEQDDDLDQDDIVILEDEDGNEHEFLIAETFDVDSRLYAVLVSADGSTDEGFIFRVEEREDEQGERYLDFVAIEDDEEWSEVEKVYNTLLEDEDEGDEEK